MPTDQSDIHAVTSTAKLPGRLYSFVACLLATFLIGLTVVAIQDVREDHSQTTADHPHETAEVSTAPSRPLDPNKLEAARLSRQRLQHLAGIALGVAILSLMPSRKSAGAGDVITAQSVMDHSGLPVLGSLVSQSQTKNASKRVRGGWMLRAMVNFSELVLCIAFVLALAACLPKPELLSTYRANPLEGYVESARYWAATVLSRLG